MPTTPIKAVDERILPFAAEPIWSVLTDAKRFPAWSPPSVSVKPLEIVEGLVGTRFEVRPRGGRAFQNEVEAVDAPRRMRMRYPGPFIIGWGEWRLEPVDARQTRVTYEVDVAAHGWVAAIIGRLLSFSKIHSKAMHDVLLALENETARRVKEAGTGQQPLLPPP